MRWIVLLIAVGLAGCVSSRPARPGAVPGEGTEIASSGPVRWPVLPPAVAPGVKTLAGRPPRDLGVVKGWHVIRLGMDEQRHSYILSRGPLPDAMWTTAKLRHADNGKEQEVEISGNFKWVMCSNSTAAVKRGTLVLVGSFYSGSYGARQDLEFIVKMNEDGWDVVWTSVLPHCFRYTTADPKATPSAISGYLARRLDEVIAWDAEAVDTVLSLRAGERGAAGRSLPRVYFGISAGAMVVPALAERAGAPDAAILAYGGASAAELMFATGLPGAGVTIQLAGGGRPWYPELRHLARLTRASTRLDPEKLAGNLRGSRVLLLTAGQDFVVPTRLQRELDESLGRPERWHVSGGHTLAIASLASRWPALRSWLHKVPGSPH